MNDMVDKIGRKLMSGDVIELPHLRDDLLLDDSMIGMNIEIAKKKYGTKDIEKIYNSLLQIT